jgi:phosphopantetheine adenylyltransferase
MSLLESLQKILVKDRNNEDEYVEITRYIIDSDEEPTAVIFGRFNPWTGKNGHGRLVDFAKENFKNYIIVSPERNDVNDLFTNAEKEEIIKKAVPDVDFLRIKSSSPTNMFMDLVYRGISRPVILVGPDRIDDFKKHFIKTKIFI